MVRGDRDLWQWVRAERNRLLWRQASLSNSFNWGNGGYLNLWGVGRDFWGECTSLTRDEVLKMLHLGEKASQVLLGNVLLGREDG